VTPAIGAKMSGISGILYMLGTLFPFLDVDSIVQEESKIFEKTAIEKIFLSSRDDSAIFMLAPLFKTVSLLQAYHGGFARSACLSAFYGALCRRPSLSLRRFLRLNAKRFSLTVKTFLRDYFLP